MNTGIWKLVCIKYLEEQSKHQTLKSLTINNNIINMFKWNFPRPLEFLIFVGCLVQFKFKTFFPTYWLLAVFASSSLIFSSCTYSFLVLVLVLVLTPKKPRHLIFSSCVQHVRVFDYISVSVNRTAKLFMYTKSPMMWLFLLNVFRFFPFFVSIFFTYSCSDILFISIFGALP